MDVSASVSVPTMSDELKRKLGALREKRPDILPEINCYALVARGVVFPDDRLTTFGATNEKRLAGMLTVVEAELARV